MTDCVLPSSGSSKCFLHVLCVVSVEIFKKKSHPSPVGKGEDIQIS